MAQADRAAREAALLKRLPTLDQIRAERERRRREAERKQLAEHSDEIRERCATLRGFVAEAWHVLEPSAPYVHGWHHDAICAHLEAVCRGEITRLQINEPPGMAKSMFVSVMWQAWEWGPGRRPGVRYFTTSYQEGYARRDSRKTLNLVQSEWYRTLWPEIVLERENEADFENTFKGARKAVAFSALTSGRGNRLIIDDPHSVDQAESDTERETATRRFRESATSRLNDPERDAIIIIMHRLHPQDVCGVIEELGLPYVKLVIPMEYYRSLVVKTPFFTDPRTYDGELLHPERQGREKVEQNKIELGEYAYQTQYQQQTSERSGKEFFLEEDLLVDGQPVDMPKTCGAVFAVIDSATKTRKENDGTGVLYCAYEPLSLQPDEHGIWRMVAGMPRPLIFLDWDYQQIQGNILAEIKDENGKMTGWLPGVFERLEELSRLCGARMGSQGVWIEDKASGMIMLQAAQARTLPAMAIDSKLTSVGKVERAIAVSGYVRQKFTALSRPAFEKTVIYKGVAKNHLVAQIRRFRVGDINNAADDLLDTFSYSVALSLGNSEGF